MAGTTRVTVVLSLYGLLKGRVVFHVASTVVSPTDPIITGAITLLEALTRGKAIHIEISLQAATVGSVTAGATYISEDKAFVRFRDAAGVPHNYRIPGPLTTDFGTDHETVNPSDTNIDNLITQVTTYAYGRGGNKVSAFVKGYRKENRKLIKGGRTT